MLINNDSTSRLAEVTFNLFLEIYLVCSASNLLTVKADKIFLALNTSGVTPTIALDKMFFDRIEHTTGRLHKVKFYCVCANLFFLIESFLSSRRL